MVTITSLELQENIDKYFELGQKEMIQVTHGDSVIFTIVPEKIRLINKWEQVFGSLPIEALSDSDINRE